MIDTDKLQCGPENAAKFKEWLATRGGLALWKSEDLSDPSRTWTTPATLPDGSPTPPPHWKCGPNAKPYKVITDAKDVEVVIDEEVKRFRVGVQKSRVAFMALEVTHGGSDRIKKAVAKAGTGAYHVFDYSTQEAVIMKPVRVVPLAEWQDEPQVPK